MEERKSVERESEEDKKLKIARVKQQINKESKKIFDGLLDNLIKKEVKELS